MKRVTQCGPPKVTRLGLDEDPGPLCCEILKATSSTLLTTIVSPNHEYACYHNGTTADCALRTFASCSTIDY
jgi:hypothetical protein